MNNKNIGHNKRPFFSLLFILVFLGNVGGQNTFQKIATPPAVAGSGLRLEFIEPENLLVAGVSPGNNSSFVQTVNGNGVAQWTKNIVGFPSQPIVLNGLARLPDGSVFVSIPFYDPQNFVIRQLVLKIAPSANAIEWAKQIGEVYLFSYGAKLLLGSSSGILLSHLPNEYPPNISLTKLDMSGNIDWSFTYDVSNNHISKSNSLATLPNGQNLVSGWIQNIVDESFDGALLWVSVDGEILKSKAYQGIQLSYAENYPNGDLLISGTYRSGNNANQGEAFIAQTNNKGEIYWAKKIKVEGIFSTCKALVTDDGGCIVFLKRILSENDYGIIIKLDGQGNIEWQRRQHGNTDISGNLTGVVAGNGGYADITIESSSLNTVLIKTDLSGNVDGCPATETCLELEDIFIDTIVVNWEREEFVNSSIPLSLELIDVEVNYVDFCETPVLPDPNFSLPDTFCTNVCTTPENLQQQTADAWQWSGSDIEFPNAQDPGEICFPENGAIQIRQIIYFGGCADTFQQAVEVIPLPDTGLKPDTTVCKGSSLILDATVQNAVSYVWENGQTLPVREIQQSGNYSVATDNGFCTAVDSINVRFASDFFDVTGFDLGRDTTLCKENDLLFGIDQNMVDEFWWNDSTGTSPRSIGSPGTYTLSAIVGGCLFSDSVVINIEDCGEAVYLPNAFSPNGDGINDTFTAHGNYHRTESLKVFDRWGGMVWDVQGDVPWDGTFKGRPAQEGIYVYLLEYTDTRTGKAKMKSGDVVLLR